MLLWLDPSVVDDAAGNREIAARALDNLLVAHLQGRHVVGFDPETYHAVKAHAIYADLSRGAKEALSLIYSQRHEMSALRRELRITLRVGRGPGFDPLTAQDREIAIGLHHFEPHERVGATNLLGENLTDTDLFGLIGSAFLTAQRLSGLALRFEAHSGGGQETHRTFERLIEKGALTLAILDGDIRYPHGPLGQTARDTQRPARTPLQHLEILPLREAENLLAIEVYEEALEPDHFPPARRANIRAFAARAPVGYPFYRHADLKKGLRLHRYFYTMKADERAFWAPLAQGAACSKPDPCTADKKEGECSCYLFEGLGDKALTAVVAWLKQRAIEDLPALFGHHVVSDLGALIAAWGAAAKPARMFSRR